MNFCQYKKIFGDPGTGLHSYRIFDIAMADLIMTIIGAYLISYYFKYSFLYTLLALLLVGIFSHKLFCVRTTIDKLLFIE